MHLRDVRLLAVHFGRGGLMHPTSLQQGRKNRVWGWANPGEEVTVAIGEQKHQTAAGNLTALGVLPGGGFFLPNRPRR